MHLFRRILQILLALYWLTLLTLTHVPKLPPVGQQVNDKLAHFLAYGALAGLLFVTLWVCKPDMRRLPLAVVVLCLAYGAFDEWTQPFFGRSWELNDWLADAAGVVVALAVLTPLRHFSIRVWKASLDRSAVAAAASE